MDRHPATRALPGAAVLILLALLSWTLARPVAGLPWREALLPTVLVPAAWGTWRRRAALAQSPAVALLWVLLPAGALLCAYMPAIASVSWDGYAHYRASNLIAQGDVVVNTMADRVNYDMDGIYEVGLYPYGTSDDDWHPNWDSILTEEGAAHAAEEFSRMGEVISSREDNPLTLRPNTVGRVPNALGLMVADLVGAPELVRLFLGRLTNLVCYALVMALAASRLKRGGWIVFAFALVPTMVFMACNYSYDPFAISMVTLAACRFVGELQRPDEPLTAAGAAWILVPFLLGTATKAVFTPCALMLLFMPPSKFRGTNGRRLWVAACCLVVLALLASFVVPFVFAGGEVGADTRGGAHDIDSVRQLAHVLGDPVGYALTLVASFAVVYNPVALFRHLFVSLCYLPAPEGWRLMTVACLAMLAWAVLADRGPEDDRWRSAALGWSTAAGIVLGFCLLATSLYLGYTNVGDFLVMGIQIRYLLFEMAPFLLVCLNFGTAPRRATDRLLAKAGGGRLASRLGRAFPAAMVWGQFALVWSLVVFGFVVRF